MTVKAPGLQTVTATNLVLEVGRMARQDFTMKVVTASQTVEVLAAAPVVESGTVSVGTVIDQRTVQEIPLNGRHFVDLGLLIPGSVTPPQNGFLTAPLRGQGSFAFNTAGNREDTVNFMINGVNLNDMAQNQITFQPTINTVQEFKVDNSTFSAEYGRNSGAIVNIATRSGHQQPARGSFRICPQQLLRRAELFQPHAGAAIAVPAQPVRRGRGRAHPQGQDVLLPELRRAAAAAGHHDQPDGAVGGAAGAGGEPWATPRCRNCCR